MFNKKTYNHAIRKVIPASFTSTSSKRKFGANKQQTPMETTCLLCTNGVLLSQQQIMRPCQVEKVLTNLCKHLEISSENILSRSRRTNTNFPFCGNCGPFMVLLWKQQQILEEEKLKFQNILGEWVHAIVTGETSKTSVILPGSSSKAIAGKQKSNFGEMILDGHRKELFIPAQQHNAHDDDDNDGNIINPEQQSTSPEFIKTKDDGSSMDPGVVAHHNYTNLSMFIGNEDAETGALTRIKVKQERNTSTSEEFEEHSLYTEEGNMGVKTHILHADNRETSGSGTVRLRDQEAGTSKQTFTCHHCSRLFRMKCHLMWHMSTHTQYQPSPSISSTNQSSPRRRQAVGTHTTRAGLYVPVGRRTCIQLAGGTTVIVKYLRTA
ncbi:unnamed protein product [Orchesella dallaii]|uniref:C2H2-type domain-containing protein n=1 Tax=Orchesella dallaii TaxID=48710 RepID=A0ABP1QKM2_9HEXA